MPVHTSSFRNAGSTAGGPRELWTKSTSSRPWHYLAPFGQKHASAIGACCVLNVCYEPQKENT